MKIKICGVCSAADAAMIAAAGADYLGVILAPRGPRQQTVASARSIYAQAGTARRVGVFADQPTAEILVAAQALELAVVQLHGGETAAQVDDIARRTGCEVWKVVAPTSEADVADAIKQYAGSAHGLLLDNAQGGSGRSFDWNLARRTRALLPATMKMIVAGGLNPQNVHEVIELLEPDVVDVASGVETNIGEKSHDRVVAFVRNART